MSKRVVCLLNGITDGPLADLGGLTPLEKACHLNLDRLVQEGSCSLLEPPASGGFAGSLLALLGVSEGIDSVPTGPLEAMGLGYFLTARQRAFSCRFVSTGGGVIVDVGDDLLSDNEGRLFCEALNCEIPGCHFIPVRGPRAILITSATSLDGGEPLVPSEAIGRELTSLMPSGTEELLGRASSILTDHEVNVLKAELEEDPVNGVWLSGGGGRPAWGPDSACQSVSLYTQVLTSAGVAKSLGVSLWRVPAGPRYSELSVLLDALEHQSSTVILDLNYLWESTYSGDLLEKIKRIEWLDTHFVAPLIATCERLHAELIISTLRHVDIRQGRVVAGPVPLVRWPSSDSHLFRFDEPLFVSCAETTLDLRAAVVSQACTGSR